MYKYSFKICIFVIVFHCILEVSTDLCEECIKCKIQSKEVEVDFESDEPCKELQIPPCKLKRSCKSIAPVCRPRKPKKPLAPSCKTKPIPLKIKPCRCKPRKIPPHQPQPSVPPQPTPNEPLLPSCEKPEVHCEPQSPPMDPIPPTNKPQVVNPTDTNLLTPKISEIAPDVPVACPNECKPADNIAEPIFEKPENLQQSEWLENTNINVCCQQLPDSETTQLNKHIGVASKPNPKKESGLSTVINSKENCKCCS